MGRDGGGGKGEWWEKGRSGMEACVSGSDGDFGGKGKAGLES